MSSIAQLERDATSEYRRRTPRSAALYQRAGAVLPGGDTRTGTHFAPHPLFIERGAGARVWDVDEHEYLDVLNNFTSLLHGHDHPHVSGAIARQLAGGTVHGSPGLLQIQLAERLTARVPSVERVRFCNSGTEATLLALRGARAFTKKPLIMKMEGGYHGSHDQVSFAMAPPYQASGPGISPGAAGEVLLGRFNDLDYTAALIRRHRDRLAAVIVEPMMGAGGAIPADAPFLTGLRAVTEECDVLLVLDEIITFRLAVGGAQSIYGITPDLTCFGKIIGGGLPVGAFGGRQDVMAVFDPTRAGSISHSGTYNGNALTMAAGLAAIELFDEPAVARLNALGDRLREGVRAIIARTGLEASIVGAGSVSQLHFTAGPIRNPTDAARGSRPLQALLQLLLLARGMFVTTRQMYVLSTPMGEPEIDRFLEATEGALGAIAAASRGAATVG
jgi:glutamate-1-semialdehyde 2,1-aminomutase